MTGSFGDFQPNRIQGHQPLTQICETFCTSSTAESFRAAIWERTSTRYKDLRQQKALAGCVDWRASTSRRPVIHHELWYFTDPDSDREIFVTSLMREALATCEERRAGSRGFCECLVIAKNNEVVLEVPTERLADLGSGTGPTSPAFAVVLSWADLSQPVTGTVVLEQHSRGGNFTALDPDGLTCAGRIDFNTADTEGGAWQVLCSDEREAQGRFGWRGDDLRGTAESADGTTVGIAILPK